MDIREVIQKRLKLWDWSVYKLVKACSGLVPEATIYDFMRGENPINSDALGHIFDVLKIDLVGRKGK